jgi:D-alanyl-D-alanine dipeptidase/CubicO group peptidase (beta-lactamase class C family)
MNPRHPALLFGLALLVGCEPAPRPIAGPVDYGPVIAALEDFIANEVEQKGLPGLSIALVDDQALVWAEGFGVEDVESERPADAHTVYRVGSVSKLFTDIAVMQRVEAGDMDLDAPVQAVLPDFAPTNPTDIPITLRQLMSHRAGLVREPPVGHYFEPTEPSLAATVASLTYLARTVLEPLGMSASGFEPDSAIDSRLADAVMWSYDGREFAAPTFELGMSPAGSMYAPMTDLALFLSALFAGGQGENGRVLSEAGLEEMWTPQFAEEGASTGRGLGFGLSELDGHRQVGHGGAIYGFATQLLALPDEKLGVAVSATRDFSNAVTSRIASTALRLMLAQRAGEPLPTLESTGPVDPAQATALAGRYRSEEGAGVDLIAHDGRLFLTPASGGLRHEIRGQDEALVVDDRLAYGPRLGRQADGVRWRGNEYPRVEDPLPAPAPERFRELIGEYGWDHNILFVFERDGRLWALIEWLELNVLEEVGPDEFLFPRRGGLYHGEGITFQRDASGTVTGAMAAGILFERREGAADGVTFRIDPVRPVEEAESGDFVTPDLVELTTLVPDLQLDIRYAGTNNFMSAPFYEQPRAFMQRPAAEALARAHQKLGSLGYGLLIHDAYRPWHVTRMFWDATPEDMKIFVANPDNGSRHNRGAAVDLTLFDRATGQPIQMTGGYDEFSERSFPDYMGGTSRQRWHRELLRQVMESEGFTVYEYEWWHFDYGGWERFPILNETFETLEVGG